MAKTESEGASREVELSVVLQALADPSRRKILSLLRNVNEMRVGDIAAAFEMSLNGVSKHLKVLESARLVLRRKEGTAHFIALHWAGLAPLLDWLDTSREFWGNRLDALESYVSRVTRSTTTSASPSAKEKT